MTPRDKQLKLPLNDFSKGVNQFVGRLQLGQVQDMMNMEFFNGELRTRGGQRLALVTNPPNMYNISPSFPNCDHVFNGVVTNRGSPNIGGMTSGQDWYIKSDIGDGLGFGTAGRSWKFIGLLFLCPAAAVVNNGATLFQWYYWSTAAGTWKGIKAMTYDLANGSPRSVSTIFGEDAAMSRQWMVLLNPHDGEYHEGVWVDDDFFEDWGQTTVNGQTGYWLRARLISGTVTASCNATRAYPILAHRPLAAGSFSMRDGRRMTAVCHPTPVVRENTSPASARWRAYADVTFQGMLDTGLPNDEANAFAYEALRTHHALMYTAGDFAAIAEQHKGVGWSTPAATTPTDGQGRIYLPSESFVYIPDTERLVITTREGPVSLQPNSHETNQFDGSAADNQFVFGKFPLAESDADENQYGAFNILKDIGTPVCMAYHDGGLLAGYSDGTLRWSSAIPNEDVWIEAAFIRLPESTDPCIRAIIPTAAGAEIYTRSAIWLLERTDVIDEATSDYVRTIRKLAGGVGAVNQSAVVDVAGSRIILSEHGVYAFDGVNDPQLLSAQLQRLFDTGINRAGIHYAAVAHWKTRGQVWFSIPRAGKYHNDLVLVWDYRNGGGWFPLEGINAEHLMYDEQKGVMFSVDRFGLVWEQGVGYSDGVAGELGIPYYVETGPFSGGAHEHFSPTEIRLHGRHYVGSEYEVVPIVEDVEGEAQDIRWDYTEEPGSNLPVDGETERQWGDSELTWAAGALQAHTRRKGGASVDASETNDFRLRLQGKKDSNSSTAPPAGNVMSIFGVTVLANPGGIK